MDPALLVAIAAVLFAGLGWIEARRSATASERSAGAAEESAREAADVARIEKERRHEERQPEWDISGQEIADDLVEFTFTTTGPAQSYEVTVEVVPGSAVQHIRKQRNGDVSVQTLQLGEVKVGVDSVFYGHVDKDTHEDMRVIVTFEAGGSSWTRYRQFPISWRPRAHSL